MFANWGLGPDALAAQQERSITLVEARVEARANSRSALAARFRAEAARQDERAASAAWWPTVGLEAGVISSNDPVAAFGGRLRQGRFTQADFDPLRLNQPDPLTDWSAAVGASWTPLDLTRGAAIQAAAAGATSAALGARWAARAAEFGANVRYLEALAAQQRVATSEKALDAAEANLAVTTRRMEQGLLTDVDVLRARAAVEGARAAVIDATRSVADARDRLALAMGWEQGLVPVPAGDELWDTPVAARPADVLGRADLRASEHAVQGAEARVRQAARARLPRVDGFARLETHSSEVFSGAAGDWTVGFQVSIAAFTGFEISARERGARALADAARLEYAERLAEARNTLAGAFRAVSAAERGAVAAAAAAAAASAAARLMRRRFEEGLATTADLLGAEASAAGLAATEIDARLRLHAAAARAAFLTDTDTDTNDDLSGGIDR